MANNEWTWTLNWSVIHDDIVVGSCPMSTGDIDRIRKHPGNTALLSVQFDLCRAAFNIDWGALMRHAKRMAGEFAKVKLENSPQSHWIEAENTIIRNVFFATTSSPDSLLDSSRS